MELRMSRLGPTMVVMAAFIAPAWGQVPRSFERQQRLFEEDIRLLIDKSIPAEQLTLIDGGGWFTTAFYLWNENSDYALDTDGVRIRNPNHARQRMYYQWDLRLWTSISIDRVHQFYGRVRGTWKRFNGGDEYFREGCDLDGFNLDRAWYKVSLARAAERYWGEKLAYDVELLAGREYVTIGTGLTLSLPLDAIQLTAKVGDLSFRGLAAMTFSSQTDVDLSRPDYDHSERNFWGGELRYRGIPDQELFAYFLLQDDQNHEHPEDPNQEYEFDSQYVGLGAEGKLLVTDLRYEAEFVQECGLRYADGVTGGGREHIQAYAFDGSLEYLLAGPAKPRVSAEYLLASGDSGRVASPINTRGGNRPNSRDTSFVAFGFRDTGLSFAPELSNLQMVRLGGSLFPLHDVPAFKEFELGLNWFLYRKDRAEGAVSDSSATEPVGCLGHELDLFANWRMTSDLSWLVRYGVFWPSGGAFADTEDRHFLLTALTFAF